MTDKSTKKRRRDDATSSLSAYDIGRVLGAGAFASVRHAVDRRNGAPCAIKEIDKQRTAVETAEREITLLKAAGGHRHICALLDHFESAAAWFLVLELVSGGEVFERVAANGPFSEEATASTIRQVLTALAHLHGRCIVHRDVKPENLLYVSAHPGADVKLADFGLAVFCGGDHPQRVGGLAGTITYMAPEALTGDYDHGVDVWAAGVCLFTLLGGYLPFDPSSCAAPEAVRRAILSGKGAAFESEDGGFPRQWRHVSREARHLIGRMLAQQPGSRPSARELLKEEWVCGSTTPTHPMPGSDANLKRFNEARRVWRMAADAIALVVNAPHTAVACCPTVPAAPAASAAETALAAQKALPPEARKELQAAFAKFDVDGSGAIDVRELKCAMKSLGASEVCAEDLLESLDQDHNGTISFDEYCAAAAPLYQSSSTALRAAFDFFDKDASGFIDEAELEVVLVRLGMASSQGRMHKEVLERIFTTADVDRDGRVSFDEFMGLFVREDRDR